MVNNECFVNPLIFNKQCLKANSNISIFPKFAKKTSKLIPKMSNSPGKEEKSKLESEKIFFEGPPSKLELVIPFLSILTVIGIIPFVATLIRQFWVQYRITNRRISVDSGFGGNSRVEIVYRDIKEIKHITRFGGKIADVVIILKDEAQLELRSLPEWEENLKYIKETMELNKKKTS